MVTTVGTSRLANNLRNEKSSTGKFLSAGSPSTIGLAIAGSGIVIHCLPDFGAGTVKSKTTIKVKKVKCDRNCLNANQNGYRLMRQIVLFSNVIISSKPVSNMSSSCEGLSPFLISSNPTMRLLLSSLYLAARSTIYAEAKIAF
jgi:hypothetical protein